MIDHISTCTGFPCTCATAWVEANPGIGKTIDGCNCIHVDGVWMTRHSTQCSKHPCTVCLMRGGDHIAHISIEGIGTPMEEDVQVRTCWSCGKQQYMNRVGEWTHVYPAAGCLHDQDTRDHNNEGARK